MYLFCPKINKNDSREPFIKKPLGAYYMLYHLVFSIFPLIFMT